MFVVMGAKALTVEVVDRVVAATNPKADQMAVLVNFIVWSFIFGQGFYFCEGINPALCATTIVSSISSAEALVNS